jgi:hypothetical protein
MAGMMAGGVVGIAVGAGLLMMPQGKHVKRVLEKSAAHVKHQVADWMK